jgi:hypothetical protein
MGFESNFDNGEGNGDREVKKTAIICIVFGIVLILVTFIVMGKC